MYLHELNRLKNQMLKTGYFELQGSPKSALMKQQCVIKQH